MQYQGYPIPTSRFEFSVNIVSCDISALTLVRVEAVKSFLQFKRGILDIARVTTLDVDALHLHVSYHHVLRH